MATQPSQQDAMQRFETMLGDTAQCMRQQQARETSVRETLTGIEAAVNHNGPLPPPVPERRPKDMGLEEYMRRRMFEINHVIAYGEKSPYRYNSAHLFRELVLSSATYEDFASKTCSPHQRGLDMKTRLGPCKDDSYFKKLKQLLK